jgi:UDP-N-acetylglucosamine transferase subunit ALG13
MIFLTVGSQFPFDRLVRAVDAAFEAGLIDEEIFGQIGESSYKPRNFRYVSSLDKDTFDQMCKKASRMIGHAGIGTITIALKHDKPLLIMPRLEKEGEVVNDHQVAIARRFETLGYVLVAHRVEDLPVKISFLKTFVPRKRTGQVELVAERIAKFLDEISRANKK